LPLRSAALAGFEPGGADHRGSARSRGRQVARGEPAHLRNLHAVGEASRGHPEAWDAFFGGTTGPGRPCMRVSVSTWQTSDADVGRTVAAVGQAPAG